LTDAGLLSVWVLFLSIGAAQGAIDLILLLGHSTPPQCRGAVGIADILITHSPSGSFTLFSVPPIRLTTLTHIN